METAELAACFEADPRPTCLFDLSASAGKERLKTCYRNPALAVQSHLLDELLTNPAFTDLHLQNSEPSCHGPFTAQIGRSLFTYTANKRWKVVQWTVDQETTQNYQGQSEKAQNDDERAYRKLSNVLKMMDSVNVGIFEFDRIGKLIWGNKAFYKLSGHPYKSEKEELTWLEATFPEDRDWLLEKWKEVASGTPVTVEMRWKRPATSMPDGKDDIEGQWVLATCEPTFDQVGNVTSVSGCLTDIATQKHQDSIAANVKAETLARFNASEAKFSAFAELASVAIWMIDANGQLRYCNREWFSISGHPNVAFEDIDWSICMNQENQDLINWNLTEISRTKRPAQFEFELLRLWENDQGLKMNACVIAGAYPELNQDGEITGFAGTLTDVTHLRWAERLQKQRLEEAIEAKRQQENFIDMTCHEIRNPLGAVVHCADSISSTLGEIHDIMSNMASEASQTEQIDALFSSATDSIAVLTSCCTHQKRIIDDILTLSKLDSKLLRIALAPVQLDNVLLEISTMFTAEAQKSGVALRTVRESSLDDLLVGGDVLIDYGRLMQVLINLVTNSLKFTRNAEQRSITVTVGASLERPTEQSLGVKFMPTQKSRDRKASNGESHQSGSTYLYFKVADTGCGIDDEQKARIFERFEQAFVWTHSQYGGSGLGLFISRQMIELQDGGIGVCSQAGKGATFAFYITAGVAPRSSTANGIMEKSREPVAQSAVNSQYSILVVEDNLINQRILRLQLQKLGHTVHVASHGGEALAFLETTSCWVGNSASAPDVSVILMDMEMPVMGGLECARRIRQAQAEGSLNRHIPIISVSANARDSHVSDAFGSGMDDSISKPFRVRDLMPRIHTLVPKSHEPAVQREKPMLLPQRTKDDGS